jgi:hypothetical protein
MLLKLIDVSDTYYDYNSLNFPVRKLDEAPA